MSDYGGDSEDDYGSDLEWLYVEDHYDEVDELVEHTCPSPTIYESHEYHEFDPYDYWADLTYLSDGVYDVEQQKPKGRKKQAEDVSAGKKRKREQDSSDVVVKRPKTAITGTTTSRNTNKSSPTIASRSMILWRPQRERDDATLGTSIDNGKPEKTYAVLKDWKEQSLETPCLPAVAMSSIDEIISSPDEDEPAADQEFDLNDLGSVAAFLSSHDIAGILREKGLDPEAVELALQAMITGSEPEFEDAEEDQKEEKGQHVEISRDAKKERRRAVPAPAISAERTLGKDRREESQVGRHRKSKTSS